MLAWHAHGFAIRIPPPTLYIRLHLRARNPAAFPTFQIDARPDERNVFLLPDSAPRHTIASSRLNDRTRPSSIQQRCSQLQRPDACTGDSNYRVSARNTPYIHHLDNIFYNWQTQICIRLVPASTAARPQSCHHPAAMRTHHESSHQTRPSLLSYRRGSAECTPSCGSASPSGQPVVCESQVGDLEGGSRANS